MIFNTFYTLVLHMEYAISNIFYMMKTDVMGQTKLIKF